MAFGVVEFDHVVVEAGHGDAALFVVKAGEDFHEGGGGVHDGAAEDAGVEVGGGSAHNDLHGRDAAEALGEGGVAFGDHPGVRDGDDVATQIAAAGADEIVEIGAADFFFAFDEEDEIDRQRAFLAEEMDGAEEVGEDLSFVVGRAAGEDAFVADGGFERRRGPEVDGFLGLDVVVAVDEDGGFARGLGAAGEDGGVSAGFGNLGAESAELEQGVKPLGAGAHVGGVLRLGRDAGEAQKFEEKIQIGLRVE